MDQLLNFIIYAIGSGDAFFIGVLLILGAIALAHWGRTRTRGFGGGLLAFVGGILVAVSATRLAWWLYALLLLATVWWLLLESRGPIWYRNRAAHWRIGLVCLWIAVAGCELRFQFGPYLPPMGTPTLYVIGDSVSAGVTEAEQGTWPRLLAARHGIEVRDFSKMGATVQSALKQAEQIGAGPGLIILEIGGNDLLGAGDAEHFETHLEELLARVCGPGRRVVMFELPLPPFANRFGVVQRSLADRYGVCLIPKRTFIDVLTTPGATIDGIHLSKRGHTLLAETVWTAIRPAYDEEK